MVLPSGASLARLASNLAAAAALFSHAGSAVLPPRSRRDFYFSNLAVVKHVAPTFPFMIRHGENLEPYMIVEYGAWPGSLRARARQPASRQKLTLLARALPTHHLSDTHTHSLDFARKAKVPLAGLDAAGIRAKLDQAVEIGEQMPRAEAHSLTHGHELPAVTD